MSLDILDGLYCILFHLNIILNFNGLKCLKASWEYWEKLIYIMAFVDYIA